MKRKFAILLAALLSAALCAPALAAEDFRSAQSIDNFYAGMAAFKAANGLTGYINLQGETVIEPAWDDGAYFCEGRAWVKQDGAYHLIDSRDNTVGASSWSNVYVDFGGSDFSRVFQGDKIGYVNLDGEIALRPVYDKATRFCDGVACVLWNGTWYLIDERGVDLRNGTNTQA